MAEATKYSGLRPEMAALKHEIEVSTHRLQHEMPPCNKVWQRDAYGKREEVHVPLCCVSCVRRENCFKYLEQLHKRMHEIDEIFRAARDAAAAAVMKQRDPKRTILATDKEADQLYIRMMRLSHNRKRAREVSPVVDDDVVKSKFDHEDQQRQARVKTLFSCHEEAVKAMQDIHRLEVKPHKALQYDSDHDEVDCPLERFIERCSA